MTTPRQNRGVPLTDFRQLDVWQLAMELAIDVHRATQTMPIEQRYELARELRRSATSIPSNIAEGFARHSRPAYRNYVAIGLGSAAELDTQVEIASRLDYLPPSRCGLLLSKSASVGRMLQSLWRSLE